MAYCPTQSLPEGAHIGVYEIKDVIRNDCLSFTYRAWNEHLGSFVSLKEYFPEKFAIRDENGHSVYANPTSDSTVFSYGLAAFIKQAEILNDMQHPNIISVHNIVPFNGTAYLAMDDEQGQRLTSATIKPNQYEPILRALLSALQHVHEKGTVHGDIHPGAILLDKNGKPILLDFAAANLALAAYTGNLLEALRPKYAAAELYEANTVGGDIYALGATLYYAITQVEPTASDKRLEAVNEQQHDPLPGLFSLAGPVANKNVLKAINRMLEPVLQSRPQTVSEVLIELDQHNEQQSSIGKTEAQTAQPLNTEKTTRWAAWVGSAVVLIGLLGIGFWLIAQKKIPSETTPLAAQKQTAKNVLASVSSTQTDTVPLEKKSKPIDPVLKNELIQGQAQAVEQNQPEQQINEKPIASQNAEQETTLTETIVGTTGKPVPTEPAVTVSTAEQSSHPAVEVQPEVLIQQAATQTTAVINAASELQKSVTAPAAENAPNNIAKELSSNNTRSPLPDPESPSEGQINVIAAHLSRAEEQLAAFQLTTPADNSAYFHYQAVLAIDPDNQQASEGIQRIVDKYAFLIEKHTRNNEIDLAELYLRRTAAISPNNALLPSLRDAVVLKKTSVE